VELLDVFLQIVRALGDNGAAIDMERLQVSLVRLAPTEDIHDDVIEDPRARHVEVKIRTPITRVVSSGKGVVVACAAAR